MSTRTRRPGSIGGLGSSPVAAVATVGAIVAGAMGLAACARNGPDPMASPARSVDPAPAPVREFGASESPADRLAADFLASPDYEAVALSPDGSRLAAIRSHGAEDQIVVFELDSPSASGTGEHAPEPQVLVRERRAERGDRASRSIETLGWAGEEHLVYAIETPLRSREDGVGRPQGRSQRVSAQAERGVGTRARKTRLHATDLEGRTRYLAKRWQGAGYSQFQHQIISHLPDDPLHVLLNYEGRAVRVDVRNGGRLTVEPAARAEGSAWAADHSGAIRAGYSTRGWDRRTRLVARRSDRDPWIVISDYDAYSEPGVWFAGFSPDPARIYVFSDLAGDRTTLHELDLATRNLGPPLRREASQAADAIGLLQSPGDDRLLALMACGDRCVLDFVDQELSQTWAGLAEDFPGQSVSILSRSADDRVWLVEASSDVVAPSIHRFEPATGRHTKLFDRWPGLAGRALAPMKIARYRTRDGLSVEAYLTRPVGAEGLGPVIVMPHDGPDERDEWGFDPVVQHLAARGFTVVQPNYRGSTGYGREFWLRAQGEWGGAVLDDVIDAARALVVSGIADPARIGIYGKGFGGYLALQALVEAPEIFAAGASFGAATDLQVLRADDRRFVGRAAVDEKQMLPADGDPRRLAASSPTHGAGRIRAPILLAHGAQDPTHHEKHADLMEAALARAGKPFESIRYAGATRKFLDDRERIEFHRRLADFFERNLSGPTVTQRDPERPETERQTSP